MENSPSPSFASVLFLRLAPFLNFEQHHPQDVMPSLPIAYAATRLQTQGHRVEIIDTWAEPLAYNALLDQLQAASFDILVIDAVTPVIESALRILTDMRERKSFFSVAIGQHASALPETVLNVSGGFDVCVAGEIEEALPELVKAVQQEASLEDVSGLVLPLADGVKRTEERPFLQNLDDLPPVDWDLVGLEKYRIHSVAIPSAKELKWGFLLAGRGCPYRCIYCSSTLRQSYGSKIRMHSPQRVADDMQRLMYLGLNTLFFEDDTFSFDKNWVLALCDEIRSRSMKVNWAVQTRADCMDEELALNMRAAGCRAVTMGIESGDERILMLLKKGETKEQMRKAVVALKKAGLVTTLFFMLGNPTESNREIKATYDFMRELAPFMIQVAFFTPYPGSAYYDEIRPDTDFSRLSHYNDLPYNASSVSDEKLLEWQKRFYRSHYLSLRFALNYLRYRAPGMLFNPSERKLLIDAAAYILRLGKK